MLIGISLAKATNFSGHAASSNDNSDLKIPNLRQHILQKVETSKKEQRRNMIKLQRQKQAEEEEERLKKLIEKHGVENVQIAKSIPLSDELLEDKIDQIQERLG